MVLLLGYHVRRPILSCFLFLLVHLHRLSGISSFLITTTTSFPRINGATPLFVKTQSSLESYTVKELREMVKEVSAGKRGILSRLKKKQDLLDYLQRQSESSSTTSSFQNSTDAALSTVENSVETSDATPHPLTMPPVRKTLQDILLERVEAMYPGVPTTIETMEDRRQELHPMTSSRTTSDLDVVFVGTASCMPSSTRGVSCTAVRVNWRRVGSATWLFDVGESTQMHIQKTSEIRPGRISKIFLTHAHGDHTFGLPGLLCLMGGPDRDPNEVVDIYGPEGVRLWIRTAIRYSVSRSVPKYRVHEICDVPMSPAYEWNPRRRRYLYRRNNGQQQGQQQWTRQGLVGEDPMSWASKSKHIVLEPNIMFGEVAGGKDIYPQYDHPQSVNGAPVWKIVDDEDVTVHAAPMSHGIPCVGYVIQEASRPGRLNHELVEPIVRRNVDALRESGFAIPMKAMAAVKDLEPGSSFTFPDGTVVHQADAVMPPRQGRKLVICGDTSDSSALSKLAYDADVVVHEATNAFLHGLDTGSTYAEVSRETIRHGHSTPEMAGLFAKHVKARALVLNHFSSRYKGDYGAYSLGTMMRIEELAMGTSGLNATQVAAAWDTMVLPIPQR